MKNIARALSLLVRRGTMPMVGTVISAFLATLSVVKIIETLPKESLVITVYTILFYLSTWIHTECISRLVHLLKKERQ